MTRQNPLNFFLSFWNQFQSIVIYIHGPFISSADVFGRRFKQTNVSSENYVEIIPKWHVVFIKAFCPCPCESFVLIKSFLLTKHLQKQNIYYFSACFSFFCMGKWITVIFVIARVVWSGAHSIFYFYLKNYNSKQKS